MRPAGANTPWRYVNAWVAAAGLLIIALCAVTFAFVERERRAEQERVARQLSGLTLAIEERAGRALGTIDAVLHRLKVELERKRLTGFDEEAYRHVEIDGRVLPLAIIAADGRLKWSSTPSKPLDLSDREHFRVHRDADSGRAFLSKPVFGRVTQKWSIQLTRRINGPGGAFAGVVVAAVDPALFADFFAQLDLRADGAIGLIGFDGAIRFYHTEEHVGLGDVFPPDAPLLEAQRTAADGVFTTEGAIDGARRITSYRTLRNYPLIASISVAEAAALAPFNARRDAYLATLVLVATGALVALALVIGAVGRMRDAHARTAAAHELMARTVANMPVGVTVIDADLNVVAINDAFFTLLDFPPDRFGPGDPLEKFFRYNAERGEYGSGDFAEHVVSRLALARRFEAHCFERMRPDGRVIEVRGTPVPGGGFVTLYTDVTARKEFERQLVAAKEHAESAMRPMSERLARGIPRDTTSADAVTEKA